MVKRIEDFLACEPSELKVVSITDGEITLSLKGQMVDLYLDHELNTAQGFPDSFKIVEVRE